MSMSNSLSDHKKYQGKNKGCVFINIFSVKNKDMCV